jgi:hypothetical protein
MIHNRQTWQERMSADSSTRALRALGRNDEAIEGEKGVGRRPIRRPTPYTSKNRRHPEPHD